MGNDIMYFRGRLCDVTIFGHEIYGIYQSFNSHLIAYLTGLSHAGKISNDSMIEYFSRRIDDTNEPSKEAASLGMRSEDEAVFIKLCLLDPSYEHDMRKHMYEQFSLHDVTEEVNRKMQKQSA